VFQGISSDGAKLLQELKKGTGTTLVDNLEFGIWNTYKEGPLLSLCVTSGSPTKVILLKSGFIHLTSDSSMVVQENSDTASTSFNGMQMVQLAAADFERKKREAEIKGLKVIN
jgi:hypothetical protein